MQNSIIDFTETSANDRIADVNLLLNHDLNQGKVLFLVEADDDKRFYEQFFIRSNTAFYPMSGHKYMEPVLSNLNMLYGRRLAAIKDADFDHLNNISRSLPNLFITDCHDMEMTCVSEERSKDVAYSFGIPDGSADNIHRDTVRDLRNYSYIRWANNNLPDNDIKLEFNADVESHIGKSIAESVTHMNSIQTEHSRNIDLGYVENLMADYPDADWRQLTNGHDYMRMLSHHIRKLKPQNIKKGEIDKRYLILFRYNDFINTDMAKDIKEYPFFVKVLIGS